MAKRNGAPSADTSHDLSAVAALFPSTATSSFMMGQRIAMEATRFWVRRMRAYADQLEELAGCTNPNQFVSVQTHFFERLKDDYQAETEALGEIWKAGAEQQREQVERAVHAETPH